VSIELHPWAEADLGGIATVQISGGAVTLDALSVPYARAEITIPWPGEITEIDPRDDLRIIISAGNSGHWEIIPDVGYGYGHGPYGHGPYGGSS
jgi:hypothetical protein